MTDQAPRLKLPYIIAAQSQKEVTHNEALNILDALVQPVVETALLSAPPLSPMEGNLWIVGATASGGWVGYDDAIAQYLGGSWSFHTPFDGITVWLRDENIPARFMAGIWQKGKIRALSLEISDQQVVGAQQGAIIDATGGLTVDTEARAALNALLAVCRTHGLIAP